MDLWWTQFGLRIALFARREMTMLRISIIDSRTERRLVLEGKLIAPWVAELRTAWKAANGKIEDRALVIDLENITIMSQEGENALLELMSEGAKFRGNGVLTKHVIQQLRRRNKRNDNEAMQAAHPRVRDEEGQK
jgi:hypothetical protein